MSIKRKKPVKWIRAKLTCVYILYVKLMVGLGLLTVNFFFWGGGGREDFCKILWINLKQFFSTEFVFKISQFKFLAFEILVSV